MLGDGGDGVATGDAVGGSDKVHDALQYLASSMFTALQSLKEASQL